MPVSAIKQFPAALYLAFNQETKLPVLSPVALRVIQLSDDPTCDARKLADTIVADPGLSARVLKLANSSYYGYGGQVTHMQQAIVLMGYSTIRNVVMGLSMTDLCASVPSSNYVENFWEHSYLTACLSFTLARLVRHTNPTYAFTAGLLHDVGKLLIQSQFSKLLEMMLSGVEDQRLNSEHEEQMFGFNHAQAGSWLAQQWHFPEAMSEAIEMHNSPSQAQQDPLLSAIVAIASFLSRTEGAELPALPEGFGHSELSEETLRKAWETWKAQRESHLKTLDFLRVA